jgi:flagella basal body P-ring formation protein FlgA
MLRLLLIAAFATLTAASSDGGEIVLRPKATPRGAVVRLGDVAEIRGGAGGETAKLAAMPLMPAPTDGAQRYLRAGEVRDLLNARGVRMNDWRVGGAASVVVMGASNGALLAGYEESTGESTAKTDSDRLDELVIQYLRQQSGHDLWSIKVEANDEALSAVRTPDVALRGGKAPWAGRQRFELIGGARVKPVYVYARIERLEMVAFAVRSIERGELVRRSDVELRPFGGTLPTQAVVAAEAVIGKEAVQAIRADSMVLSNYVRSPIVVRRGERVSVRARAGGVVVRTFAIAQQEGSMGDLVAVQAAEGKERYTGRVSGVRELEVFAAEPTATEMASASQPVVR